MVIALFASCSHPLGAFAKDAKEALPSIQKFVSLDGKDYLGEVTAAAGSNVKYRLVMTVPECVAELKTLDYTAHDKPNSRIDVNASTAKARIVDEMGNTRAVLSPKAWISEKKLVVALGDLKAACPGLRFGDSVVVDYDATVQSSTPAGAYPNVAKLVYDMGEGPEQTVEVEAKVNVPTGKEPEKPESKPGVPKTGDELSIASLAGAAIASGSVLALAYARLRRD